MESNIKFLLSWNHSVIIINHNENIFTVKYFYCFIILSINTDNKFQIEV